MRACAMLLLVGGLLAATGCNPLKSGGSATPTAAPLPASAVERRIESTFPAQLPGLALGPARCPARLDPTDDQPASCSITVEGEPVQVSVTRSGDSGYHVALAQAVVSLAELETSIEHRLRQRYSVDCGAAAVRVLSPPGVIACRASSAARTVQLDVTIQNAAGDYSFEEHQN